MSVCTSGVAQSFQHLKSLFLDFYRGEEMPPGSGPGANPGQAGMQIALKGGLQHIISIVEGPSEHDDAPGTQTAGSADDLEQLYRAGAVKAREGGSAMLDTTAAGRTIHLRVYAIVPVTVAVNAAATQLASTTPSNVKLEETGPSFDFVLRRRQMPSMDRLNASLKRPKTHAEKNRQGKGKKKNIETDEMGDMVGRVHVGKQDLSKLQTRKMKGLKRSRTSAADGDDDQDDDDDDDDDNGEEPVFESAEDQDSYDGNNSEAEAPKKQRR